MKTQSLTMGLAFLVAAFMWGCQEQGSGPVGPDGLRPQFDKAVNDPECPVPLTEKGHCHDEDGVLVATFTAKFTGDVTAEVVLAGPQGNKKLLQHVPGELGTLSLPSSFRDLITGGDACFGAETFNVAEGTGGLIVSQNKPGSTDANISFSFDAEGTDNADNSLIRYQLVLDGDIVEGVTWPDDGSTINGGNFDIGHGFGPGRESACTGTGTLSFSMALSK